MSSGAESVMTGRSSLVLAAKAYVVVLAMGMGTGLFTMLRLRDTIGCSATDIAIPASSTTVPPVGAAVADTSDSTVTKASLLITAAALSSVVCATLAPTPSLVTGRAASASAAIVMGVGGTSCVGPHSKSSDSKTGIAMEGSASTNGASRGMLAMA